MKTKTYKNGKFTFRTYQKSAGNGHECGVVFGGKTIFVGNFIHTKEANQWWTLMNKEIRSFGKKYWVTKTAPVSWYKNFLAHHLYKKYYAYLNKAFNSYNRDFNKKFNQSVRKYSQLKKKWTPKDKTTVRLAS